MKLDKLFCYLLAFGLLAAHTRADEPLGVQDMVDLVEVVPSPWMNHGYAIMEEGVLQHLDRDYDYYYMPDEMRGGLLFQGIHRAPTGQEISMSVDADCTIYYFWHHSADGGYGAIFPTLPGWTMVATGNENDAPKYDSLDPAHGKPMYMATYQAVAGEVIDIPATTSYFSAFSIVFKFDATKPSPPSNELVGAEGNIVSLSWVDNATEETGYTIERAYSASSDLEVSVLLDSYNGSQSSGPYVAAYGSTNSFQAGARQASDRTDLITSVPSGLRQAARLVVPRDDKNAAERSDMYVVTVSKACTVYAGFDKFMTSLPSWIVDQGWENSGLTFTTSSSVSNPWKLYQKTFPAGQIELGSVNYTASNAPQGTVFAFVTEPLIWESAGQLAASSNFFQEGAPENSGYFYRVRANGAPVNSSFSDPVYVATGVGSGMTYSSWALGYGLSGDGLTTDSDLDGVLDFFEYAFDGDPLNPEVQLLPSVAGASGDLTYTFHRGRADLTYTVLSSVDLSNWDEYLVNPGLIGNDVVVNLPIGEKKKIFFRLKVD